MLWKTMIINLKNTNIHQSNITQRNYIAENKWTSRQIDQFNIKQTMDNNAKIHTKLTNNKTILKSNYTLFADDAAIDINNLIDLEQLLNTYAESTNEYILTIQWAKIIILTKQNLLKIPK